MTVVIDVGCARYNGDYSLERLVEEFDPTVVYGFDPNWDGEMTCETGVPTHIYAIAAWTYDGVHHFHADGLNSCLTLNEEMPQVPCMDLAAFIARLPAGARVIVKMDCEGAEYELLEHMIDCRVDALLELLWVEWHPDKMDPDGKRRAEIEREVACEIKEWNW